MNMSFYRVTILKDKETRESKGVAFVLFLDRQSAFKAVSAINKKQVCFLCVFVEVFASHLY